MKLKNYDDNSEAVCSCGCSDFEEVDKNYIWECVQCRQTMAYMAKDE
jgi:hypothetical protein